MPAGAALTGNVTALPSAGRPRPALPTRWHHVTSTRTTFSGNGPHGTAARSGLAQLAEVKPIRHDPAMARDELLGRITADPDIFGGKPIVRGMRISVELVLSLLAQGETEDALLDDYPELEPEDIRACLAYARAVIANDTLEAVPRAIA